MTNNEINDILHMYNLRLENSKALVKSGDLTVEDAILYQRLLLSNLLDKLNI